MAKGNSADNSEMKPAGRRDYPAEGGLRQSETKPNGEQRDSGDEYYSARSAASFFSVSQKIIIVLMVLTLVLLVCILFKYPKGHTESFASPSHKQGPAVASQQPAATQRGEQVKPQPPTGLVPEVEVTEKNEQPLSLQTAQNLESQNNYQQALEAYQQLAKKLPKSGLEGQILADFLQFKMAMCLQKMSEQDEAEGIFKTLANSSSPVIRCFAAYNSIGCQIANKQYLAALTNTYRCLGLLELLNLEQSRLAGMTRNCHFLAAQCLTQNILLLSEGQARLPEQLWIYKTQIDPFTASDQTQILSQLESGCEILNKAMLSPQIQKVQQSPLPLIAQQAQGPDRWQVTCYRASVEELLSRFATAAGFELKWDLGGSSEQANIRKRVVTLNLPFATPRQVAATAAGCAGLLASIDDKGLITVSNPAQVSLLSEQLSRCSEQAINLWHQFLIRFDQDESVVNAHFALALLYAQTADIPKAIAEFKLVANRFSRSALVPFALLNSSRLKTNIKDYSGAREDLLQLVEQYPDADVADEAVSYLADATMKASLFSEARPLYKKLYDLNLSPQSQVSASFSLGVCLFEEKEYEESIKWLTRYLNLAKNPDLSGDENFYRAYLLIGKAYLCLDKADQACSAFQYALAGKHSPEEYILIISALVDSFIARDKLVEALAVLDGAEAWRLSQKENVQILLLKARVLRQMGLVDRAILLIGDRSDYVSDRQLKAQILFELANCYKADGRLELARRNLSDILTIAEKGELFDNAAIELADVCRKQGRNSEAVSVCIQMLNAQPKDDVKKKVLSILADAYRSQKDYDKALLALMGKWKVEG
jgi:tetratricopeptide (TPR) repeat protein